MYVAGSLACTLPLPFPLSLTLSLFILVYICNYLVYLFSMRLSSLVTITFWHTIERHAHIHIHIHIPSHWYLYLLTTQTPQFYTPHHRTKAKTGAGAAAGAGAGDGAGDGVGEPGQTMKRNHTNGTESNEAHVIGKELDSVVCVA